MIAAGLAVTASSAWAAPTVCTTVPSGPTYDATIAVASNFFGPAQDLVTLFTAPGAPGEGSAIRICHNATATLLDQIENAAPTYSLFLAADDTTDSLVSSPYVPVGATSETYATGIPVLFARQVTVGDVQTLIPGVSSGVSATISSVVTGSEALNPTNAQTVAVANPTLAPYGNAAKLIIQDMGFTWNPPSSPTWISSLYDNISLTFNSVAVTPFPNKSGFVSKAQICSGITGSPPTYVYVEFTNSKYLLNQKGILIDSQDSNENNLGAALWDYMLDNPNMSFWPNFLSTHCYGPI
jgi:hypothetical protein